MAIVANLLQEKAGLTPEQANVAEQLVLQHLSANVPPQYHDMLGSVLGSGNQQGSLGSLIGDAEKLFGSK